MATAVDPVDTDYYESNITWWTGWIGFAATMLIFIGSFSIVAGFVGIFKDGYYVVPTRDLVVTMDYTAWGWIHLALGLIAIGIAVGMLAGKMWARVIAVGIALLSALVNLAFLNAAPVWSTIVIAFDILLVWALTVHGREMQSFADS